MRHPLVLINTLFVFCAMLISTVAACPTCKEGLGENNVKAYGWSIMFMMSVPYTILLVFAVYVGFTVWKNRAKQKQAALSPEESLLDLAKQKAALGIPTQPPADN